MLFGTLHYPFFHVLIKKTKNKTMTYTGQNLYSFSDHKGANPIAFRVVATYLLELQIAHTGE